MTLALDQHVKGLVPVTSVHQNAGQTGAAKAVVLLFPPMAKSGLCLGWGKI